MSAIGKTQQWPQDWKRSVFISIPKKLNAKECSNYCIIVLISHPSKVMLKILQAKLQQYVNWELPNVQARFRKGRGTRDQIANIHWIIGWNDPKKKKQESSRETSTSASLTTLKPLTVWITTNSRKFFKRREYQTTWPASWEVCMQVKEQQLEPDMEQWTGSKLGKENVKAVYCYLAYLTYMRVHHVKCWTGWSKVGSSLQGEISITSGVQMIPPYGRKWRGTKAPLDVS